MRLALSRNSTNVRNVIDLAWHRLHLAVAASLAPPKAVDLAARLFATPPRHPHRPQEMDFLRDGGGFAVPTAHGQVAAWRFGPADRPAVLLSHGWGGRGAQMRGFVKPLLEAGYQAVLFDHPGHGFSDGRRSSLVHFAQALEAVADATVLRGVRIEGVVGHSLGAAAAAAWLNDSRRELRAVLVAPPTSVERYAGAFARRLGLSEAVRRAMQEHFERTLGRAWREFELPQAVAHVRARALVVHDAGDREVPMASGLALARAWRGARFVATRGLGHRAILRDPEVTRDAADFIAARTVFPPPPAPGEPRAFRAPAAIF